MENWNWKLYRAARDGDIEALELSLQNDADIDTQNGLGWTALMVAAIEGHLEVCRLLIDRGCKIDTTSPRNGHTELMLEDGFTALMKAARYGHLEICRLLIDRGCKIDTTNEDGDTALHYAAGSGQLQTTRYLVEQGSASPLVTNYKGKTPYDLAAESKQRQYKEVMEYLQVHNVKNQSGRQCACVNSDTLHGDNRYIEVTWKIIFNRRYSIFFSVLFLAVVITGILNVSSF